MDQRDLHSRQHGVTAVLILVLKLYGVYRSPWVRLVASTIKLASYPLSDVYQTSSYWKSYYTLQADELMYVHHDHGNSKECVKVKGGGISLSSEIWSSIDVYSESMAPWNPGTPITMVAHFAKLCLRRSRDRSLSVKFDSEEVGSPVNFKDIFDIFSPYSNRWEELFLSLSMLPAESRITHSGLWSYQTQLSTL